MGITVKRLGCAFTCHIFLGGTKTFYPNSKKSLILYSVPGDGSILLFADVVFQEKYSCYKKTCSADRHDCWASTRDGFVSSKSSDSPNKIFERGWNGISYLLLWMILCLRLTTSATN